MNPDATRDAELAGAKYVAEHHEPTEPRPPAGTSRAERRRQLRKARHL